MSAPARTASARLAHLLTHHRRRVLLAAGGVVLAGLALSPVFQAGLRGVNYATPGSDSYRAQQFIAARTGIAESDALVVWSPEGRAVEPAAVRTAARAARAVGGGAVLIGAARASPDGQAVAVTIGLRGTVAARQRVAGRVQTAVARAVGPGVHAGLTGDSPLVGDLTEIEKTEMFRAEVVGLPIAAVILVIAFGSVVAAGLPLLLGLSGLFVSFGVVALLMTFWSFNAFVESMMAAIGIAVGIDYALLMVRRYREERARGGTEEAIIGRTLATAGRTIAFSGVILSTSLVPLLFTNLPLFDDTALAIIVVVLAEVVLLLTFLPAVLLALGDRLDRGTVSARLRSAQIAPPGTGGWYRWAHRVMRRPLPVVIGGVGLLLLAASPVLGLRTGIDLNARAMPGEPSVRPLLAFQRHFPAAGIGPLEVLVRAGQSRGGAPTGDLGAATGRVELLLSARRELGGVVATPVSPRAALVSASLRVGADTPAAEALVRSLRHTLGLALPPGTSALVSGVTAQTVDYARRANAVTRW